MQPTHPQRAPVAAMRCRHQIEECRVPPAAHRQHQDQQLLLLLLELQLLLPLLSSAQRAYASRRRYRAS